MPLFRPLTPQQIGLLRLITCLSRPGGREAERTTPQMPLLTQLSSLPLPLHTVDCQSRTLIREQPLKVSRAWSGGVGGGGAGEVKGRERSKQRGVDQPFMATGWALEGEWMGIEERGGVDGHLRGAGWAWSSD